MSSTISVLRSEKRLLPRWILRLEHWFRPYERLTEAESAAGKTPRFRHWANALELWGLQAVLLAAVALCAPRFWHTQLQCGPVVFLLTVVALLFFVAAPWEWFFHRFGLHGLLAFRLIPFLKIQPETGSSRFARACRRARNTLTIACVYHIAKMTFGHGAHHKITDVTPVNPDRLSELFSAISRYEITANDQTEDAVFPHFSLVGFWVFFLPFMVALQLLANGLRAISGLHIPYLPVLLASTVAMTWQVWVYENSHAVMHKPYAQWWKPRIERSIFGRWFSAVYRFHFFHHMNETSSLGVVGAVWFCYFWDWAFGTYKLARIELIEAASGITDDVLELRPEDVKMLPGARSDDFTVTTRRRRWIESLDRHAAVAKETWNGLFVSALIEVRRRRAAAAEASTTQSIPIAINTSRARVAGKPQSRTAG